jgi:hypothetical protein
MNGGRGHPADEHRHETSPTCDPEEAHADYPLGPRVRGIITDDRTQLRLLTGMSLVGRWHPTSSLQGSITMSRPLTCNVMAELAPSCCLCVLVDQPAEDPSPSYSRR